MVYVMNVDWNWIKQRPHFIAELLNDKFEVHVMYQHRYRRKGLQQRINSTLDIKPIYVISTENEESLSRKKRENLCDYILLEHKLLFQAVKESSLEKRNKSIYAVGEIGLIFFSTPS